MDYTFFEYRKSTPVCYGGMYLDSILELKFLLSIEETHAYLRDGIEIYYEEHERPRKYVPDFLIRNWKTKEATLIEVKPDSYDHYDLLAERRRVAQDFIGTFGYDWQYKLVFEADIHLSVEQYKKFTSILAGKAKKHNRLPHSSLIQEEQYRLFVRGGCVPAPSL